MIGRAINNFGRHLVRPMVQLWPSRGEQLYRLATTYLTHRGMTRAIVCGMLMELDLSEAIQSRYYYGLHEKLPYQVLRAILGEGDIFVDVGANVGFYSLVAARLVGPSGRVVAFEPGSEARSRLETNLRLNRIDWVIVSGTAVINVHGTQTTFYVPRCYESQASRQVRRSLNGGLYVRGEEQRYVKETVNTVTLDRFLADHNMLPTGAVKIDVEGAELLVLAGMAGLLHSSSAPTVICEVHPTGLARQGHSVQEAVTLLREADYRIWISCVQAGVEPIASFSAWDAVRNRDNIWLLATKRPDDAEILRRYEL